MLLVQYIDIRVQYLSLIKIQIRRRLHTYIGSLHSLSHDHPKKQKNTLL